MSARRHDHRDLPRDLRPPYRSERDSYQSPIAYSPLRSYRPRPRWPPQPSVEDEAVALQKEAGLKRVNRDDEVSQRGTIDQDPILIDLAAPTMASKSHSTKPPPRHRPTRAPGVPTPPASDDERNARGRKYGPQLDTGIVPEMTRAPSPYHYTPNQSSNPKPFTRTTSWSADPTTPPSSSSGISTASQKGTTSASSYNTSYTAPPRSSAAPPMARKNTAVPTGNDRMAHDVGAVKGRGQRRPTGPTLTRADSMAEPPYSPPRELPSRPSAHKRPLLRDDHRRYTDSLMDFSVSREKIVDNMRRPAPLMVASLREVSGQQSPQSPARTPSDKFSSRTSPRTSLDSVHDYPPSPPRSPRVSLDRGCDTLPTLNRRSLQASGEASTTNSPQHSPKIGTVLPATAVGWQSAFDSNTARVSVSRAPTRLATATHQDDVDNLTCGAPGGGKGISPIQRVDSLPYPVDDFLTAMPEERDHQFWPESMKPSKLAPAFAKSSAAIGALSGASNPSPRPPMPKHHSFVDTAPPTPDSPFPARQAKVAFASPEKTLAKPASPSLSTRLPSCPRPQYTSGHDDWYTLDGCPDFDICPHCLQNVFGPTFYAAFFRQVPAKSRSPTAKVRCDFSIPWMRLAWLLTVHRQLPNLNLLKELHRHLDRSHACPDTVAQPRQWFTILDEVTRRPMTNLHICETDVRAIEILMPLLRGFWVPHPGRSSSSTHHAADHPSRFCSLRTTHNSRFAIYVDSLIRLHEEVQASAPNRVPDMVPFVKLVKHKLGMDECPRDNILQGAKWYYMPSLPEFTVCQDCHDDIIVPLLESDCDLAMRLNRTPQHLNVSASERGARDSVGSFKETTKEASCSLYSARMRRCLRRAAQDNDLKYLSKKAKDRKKKEIELQREAQPLIAKIREIDERVKSYEGRPGGEKYVSWLEDDRNRLEDALERCRDEWAVWE